MRICNVNSLDKIAQTKCLPARTTHSKMMSTRDEAKMTVAAGSSDVTDTVSCPPCC